MISKVIRMQYVPVWKKKKQIPLTRYLTEVVLLAKENYKDLRWTNFFALHDKKIKKGSDANLLLTKTAWL